MNDDNPNFCPRCRSPRDPVMRLTTFTCGSRVEPRWESGECLRRRIVILEQENAALVERVKRLEEAGDRMRLLCADGDDCDARDKAKATP